MYNNKELKELDNIDVMTVFRMMLNQLTTKQLEVVYTRYDHFGEVESKLMLQDLINEILRRDNETEL